MGINSNPLFLILLSFGGKLLFLVEYMRGQSLNTCHRVGVRVTSHIYWRAWGRGTINIGQSE
jgi:hypothetical protein